MIWDNGARIGLVGLSITRTVWQQEHDVCVAAHHFKS